MLNAVSKDWDEIFMESERVGEVALFHQVWDPSWYSIVYFVTLYL